MLLACAALAVLSWGGCTPPGPRALLRGEQLIHEGKYSQAIEKLKLAVSHLDRNAQAWNHLGLAYHGAGHYPEALRAYQQALLLDRNLAAARFNLGCLWLEQNNFPAAISELTTFTAFEPRNLTGWLMLGEAQLRAGQWDAAERSYLGALRLDSHLPQALNDLGVIQVYRKRPRDGGKFFYAALQTKSNYPPALLNLAVLDQEVEKNYSGALQYYRAFLSTHPSSPQTPTVQQIVAGLDSRLHPAPPKPMIAENPPPKNPLPAPVDFPKTNPSVVANVSTSRVPNLASNLVATKKDIPLPLTASTNLIAMAPTADQKPMVAPMATNHVASAVPLTNAAPLQITNAPLEEVKLAQDELPKPPTVPPPAQTTETPTNRTIVQAPRSLPPPRQLEPPVATAPEPRVIWTNQPKKGWVARANPLNWFHGEQDEPSIEPAPIRPGPIAANNRPSEIVAIPARQTNAAPARPQPPPEPVFPRYTYRVRGQFQAGNRSQAEPLFIGGARAQQQGALAAAVESYQRALRIDPSYFEAYYNLGLAAYELRNWPLALGSFEAAAALQPTSADARYNFALALERADYPIDALRELEKLLAARPNEARAHLTMGNIYAQKMRRPDLARPHYLKLLELNPNHPQASGIRFWLVDHPG